MGRIRAAAAGFALLCLSALPGCDVKLVKLQLPSFFSAGVTQLWFWRLDERSGGYVRNGRVEVDGLVGPSGAKSLQYTIIFPNGTSGVTLKAPVAVSGDSIIVGLNYTVFQHGWYRVSARNGAGESPLSQREIYL